MNFSQLQERVRFELLRRIERRTLSVSLLARQTGLGQSHISNFLRTRRGLSLGTLDKILAALRLTVADLLPAQRAVRGELLDGQVGETGQIPLVSHAVALGEPYIRASSVQTMVPFPAGSVQGLRERCTHARRQWERFVAVRMGAVEAQAMEPLVGAEALVVLDRHYNSFRAYRERGGEANVYGVRVGMELKVRYADFQAGRVVLRPLGMGFPVEVVEPAGGETANDLLVGRVVLVLREC
jgi:transcriptional regulator with XRE-family HTH domain